MRFGGLLTLTALGSNACFAQVPEWSPVVANIIYTHCSSCHHDGGIGPFPLMSYEDAIVDPNTIAEAVGSRHMPPWPADPEYRHFAQENILTPEQIDQVVLWALGGTPQGNPDLEPDPPTFPPGGSLLNTIDHQVAIPPYTLQSNNDEYRWFAIPNPFPTTVYINAIEVFPGLNAVVHHADLSYDNTGATLANDLADPLPGFNGNTGSPTYSYYMNAWQPGGNVVRYPPQWGIAVPPGSDFVIEIHYGPGAQGQVDSTVMNLEFVTGPGIRPVSVGWLLGHGNMTDGPLFIPANTVRTFHQEWTVPSNRSFVSICPHMHSVGVAYTVWYEHLGDSIPLIRIPHWDFHWQRYYTFQSVQPIPAGAVIKSIGVYDNTVDNEQNPNNPPQNVYAGSTTEAEMFLTFFIWTSYQTGDEDIILDSTLFAAIAEQPVLPSDWMLFPSPVLDALTIDPAREIPDAIGLRILDAAGRQVHWRSFSNGLRSRDRVGIASLPQGLYHAELVTRTGRSVQRFVKE